MPAMWLEKLLYPLAVWVLYLHGRVGIEMVRTATLDLIWLALFVIAWLKTRDHA